MATFLHPPDSDEQFKVKFDKEKDGRWIAEIPELPGVLVYGATKSEAEFRAVALALRVLADRTEQVKKPPKSIRFL
jgi:predicted RNase H-like HicB family nuclease